MLTMDDQARRRLEEIDVEERRPVKDGPNAHCDDQNGDTRRSHGRM